MDRATYEAKRNARLERLQALAAKAAAESESNWNQAHQMSLFIPFGQPILIGHHSEKRDRNYRARIEGKHRKGYELHQKAQYYAGRAEAMQNNNAIFSDDPDAAEKLGEKIARLEKRQDLMKAANKLVKKNDRDGLAALGFSDDSINRLFTPDFCNRIGFASYEITNNGANIRRLKERLESIERHAQDETSEKVINGIRIVDSVEDNRVQIYFGGKPADEVRAALKQNGFRWTPTAGAWQTHRSTHAQYKAEQIINKYFTA